MDKIRRRSIDRMLVDDNGGLENVQINSRSAPAGKLKLLVTKNHDQTFSHFQECLFPSTSSHYNTILRYMLF